jgi:Flp pilus assembly protein TadG
MSAIQRGLRSRRGQAVVEFALVLPLVLMLVVSVFELARAWNLQQVITDAAREGARIAVIGSGQSKPDGQIRNEINDAVDDALSVAGVDPATATVSMSGLALGRGTNAVVGISLPYRFIFLSPMIKLVSQFAGTSNTFKGSITLKTSFTMRNE